MSDTQYTRLERNAPLSVRTKFSQGIGSIPGGIKNWAFNTFLLLYYNQVLGVEAYLVSAALMISLFFDAVTDPMVGALSDRLRTRWGRRHPLMIIAFIPLAACMYAVFNPIEGLSNYQLFFWLLTFSVLTRSFMTLYFIPWVAVGLELSEDYYERTSVMAYRFAIGWTVGIAASIYVFNFVMVDTTVNGELLAGQLNPASYPTFSAICALLMVFGATACILLTWREIPYLRVPVSNTPKLNLKMIYQDTATALNNDQLRLKFICLLIASMITGAMTNLLIYLNTFFWELSGKDLAWMSLSTLGALLVFPLLPHIQKRWDKKSILIFCYTLLPLKMIFLVSLRLADLLPENSDPLLLAILVVQGLTTFFLVVLSGIISSSISGDILDDQELKTGLRQEGVFASTAFFAEKVMTGVGIMIGGTLLSIIDFPTGELPGAIAQETIDHLGIVVGICIPILYVIPTLLFTRYRITRDKHQEIRRQLEQTRKRKA